LQLKIDGMTRRNPAQSQHVSRYVDLGAIFMASDRTFGLGDINVSDMAGGLGAILAAPVVLPVSVAVSQPIVQSAIRDAIAFSERCKEAVAAASERIEDVVEAAQASVEQDMMQRRNSPAPSDVEASMPHPPMPHSPVQSRPVQRRYGCEGRSRTAGEMMDAFDEMNAQVGWLTDGAVDLRTVLPLGLGAFAVRQLLFQGLRLDDIPWYTMAWYAFDSFGKLNNLPPATIPPALSPAQTMSPPDGVPEDTGNDA
jgi:hypothetical protein